MSRLAVFGIKRGGQHFRRVADDAASPPGNRTRYVRCWPWAIRHAIRAARCGSFRGALGALSVITEKSYG